MLFRSVNESKEYLCVFTDKNTAKRIHISDINLISRAKKGTNILKSPKSKKYSITKAFNIGSKSIFGIIDKEIGYLKSSDISILDLSSTGTVYTKKNVDNVFVVTKLTDITSQDKEDDSQPVEQPKIVDVEEVTTTVKKDTTSKEEKTETVSKETSKKETQLTMSDFFEEFKL